jgi:hypothetical protein
MRVNVIMSGRVVSWECVRTGGHSHQSDVGQSKKHDLCSRVDSYDGNNNDRRNDDGRTYCL